MSKRVFFSVAGGCAFCLVLLLTVACGGSADAGGDASSEPSDGASASAPAAASSSGVQAAKAQGTIETKYFKTVLPEGWSVAADDIERMGLMTVSKEGTASQQSVYFKFEGGGKFTDDPMQLISKFAGSYNGTPAEAVTINGIDWARTSYTYNGLDQTLMITNHDGYKFTFTIMGDGYEESPGVKAILDGLELI
jgi:hypothetical protein